MKFFKTLGKPVYFKLISDMGLCFFKLMGNKGILKTEHVFESWWIEVIFVRPWVKPSIV